MMLFQKGNDDVIKGLVLRDSKGHFMRGSHPIPWNKGLKGEEYLKHFKNGKTWNKGLPKELNPLTGRKRPNFSKWIREHPNSGQFKKGNLSWNKKELLEQMKKENFELGYILGVYKGDGSIHKVYKKGKRTNHFHFLKLSVADLDFLLFFKKILEKWSNKKLDVKFENREDCKNHIVYRVQLCYAEACKFLSEYDIFSINSIYMKKGFIKGFFDSEGCVQFYFFNMSNTNLILLKLIQKWLLEDFQIYSRINNGNKDKGEYRLFIYKEEMRRRFYQLIGCTIKRKLKKLRI